MITQDDIERAMQWIEDNADSAAQARADRLYLDEFTKSLKAELMLECANKCAGKDVKLTLGAQEQYALSHPSYLVHLKGLGEAIRLDTKNMWLKSVAESRLEIFRTQEATRRLPHLQR